MRRATPMISLLFLKKKVVICLLGSSFSPFFPQSLIIAPHSTPINCITCRWCLRLLLLQQLSGGAHGAYPGAVASVALKDRAHHPRAETAEVLMQHRAQLHAARQALGPAHPTSSPRAARAPRRCAARADGPVRP